MVGLVRIAKNMIQRFVYLKLFVYKRKPAHLERFIREESSQRAPPFFFVDGGSIN